MSHSPASTEQGVTLTLDGHAILFPTLPYDIKARADAAVADTQLQSFVEKATRLRDGNRKRVCGEVFGNNYDAMRELAGQIKQHTLDHLDYYLEQFTAAAESTGAKVHFAVDAEAANAICVDIAKANNCKLCVKSKSMVTEETRLVPALEAIGVETVETDLGEFIIQVDHDAPSHIVQPMIHKDRASVGRAFQREMGVPYTDDPETLTQIARKFLREKYRRADLGLTGANFLVAETGTAVTVTNEGNGRLCSSVPRVQVVFVGIEKLVPKLEHLGVLLKLLARSATNQPLTCYTHFMTGPKRPHEPDGPEELHIILVDNGRTDILHPETREMLRCIRCGACLNACPVYRKIGGHAYGAVYSGPIGALITPMFKGIGNFKDLPQASSLCGACYEACPVKINIPKYLVQLRGEMVKRKMNGLADSVFYGAWAASLKNALTYRLGQWAQRWMLRGRAERTTEASKYVSRAWVRDAPGPMKGWTSQRDMPAPPQASFRDWWATREKEGDKRG